MNAALETTLAVELFLNENYLFRRNVLNGKVEFATKSDKDVPPEEAGNGTSDFSLDWRPLTQEALNSIYPDAWKSGQCQRFNEAKLVQKAQAGTLTDGIKKAQP